MAIIMAVKQILHQMRRNRNGFVVACANCLLGCIESMVAFFNVYAFTCVFIRCAFGFRLACDDLCLSVPPFLLVVVVTGHRLFA
jgi:hypothetical protein